MWRVLQAKTGKVETLVPNALAWIVLTVLIFTPGQAARGEPAFSPAPADQEIPSWSAPEGLYQRGNNLVVVARYDESSASTNILLNSSVLLSRVRELVKIYIVGEQDIKLDQYRKLEQGIALSLLQQPIISSNSKDLAQVILPNEGFLIVEIFDGIDYINRRKHEFSNIDRDKVNFLLKREFLQKNDVSGLTQFAAKNGEHLDLLLLTALSMDPMRLLTITPLSGNPLFDRDELLRMYCNGSQCALRPEVHLAQARSMIVSDPPKATVHALLARWTSDPVIWEAATTVLRKRFSAKDAELEFFTVLEGCRLNSRNTGSDLFNLILARCGFYWATGLKEAS